MAQLASDVGNQAFASTLGRSPLAREAEQGAGIMADGTVHSDVQSTIDSTRGAGTALDPGVAERLSASLGDLSDVRVHTDDTADKLNRSVSARAFATGTDVYFAQRRVQPGLGVRRQADRARAGARRPAARRELERPAHRVAARRRDGARGRLRRRSDPLTRMAELADQRRLRLHRPPRDGRGRARRLVRPEPRRPVPRPLHLRRPRARAEPRRLGLGRRRPARAGHRGARARPARRRRARDLRRAGAEPALRAPVRVPAGRRHAQAPEPAPGRPPAVGRGRLGRRRDDGVRARRAAARQGRDPPPGRRADAARRAADQALGPARGAPARRRDGRPAGRRQAAHGPASRPRPRPRRGGRSAGRDARAPVLAAGRARRPGRRGAGREGVRPRARRRAHPRDRRRRTRWRRRR